MATAVRSKSVLAKSVRAFALTLAVAASLPLAAADNPAAQRARALGVPFEGQPGALNAITDVAGVTVGQVTLIDDQALRSRNVPTRLVVYPGESHGLTVPSYLKDRMMRNLGWFSRFLKGGE